MVDVVNSIANEVRILKEGDYVRIVKGTFLNLYAVITDERIGDEYVINYFERKEKWWVLKPNDFDLREAGDLMMVEAKFDNHGHATFDE